jgi:hypothetical protein
VSGPEEVEAPNGVRAVEHRLAGESRVRAEAGAVHDVDDHGSPVEVQLGAGALWVSVPPGGAEVRVNHGGAGALISSGAVMVEAGEGSDGLLVVTSGEVELVDATGWTRVLVAGEAAMLGADGELAGVDQVGDDELDGDPWAAANRALDAAVVIPEPEVEEPEPEEPSEPEAADEVEPEPDEVEEQEPEALEEQEPEPTDAEPDAVIDTSAVEGEPGPWLPPPEDSEPVSGELLDELYAPPEAEAHEVSGRSFARVLEIAALIVFIAVAALLVFLFNHDNGDNKKGDTQIATPETARQTTTSTSTTKPKSTTSTTPATVPIKIDILTCTQKGEALVANGSVEGAPKTADGYRITVVVKLGNRTFGRKTVTVPRGDNATGKRTWTAEIPLNGDAVGAGAQCKIPKDGGVSLV